MGDEGRGIQRQRNEEAAMKNHEGNRERTTLADEVRRIASLAAAVRVICIAHQLSLRDQSLTVARHPQAPVQIDFTGREPFGFAFTEGSEATFHVPSRHRFVIEHIHVSSPNREHADVQLVTKSPHMYRQLTLTSGPDQASLGKGAQTGTSTPILVHESTANTFLFGDGEAYSSSTVPLGTYVQVWGYLEPTHDALSS